MNTTLLICPTCGAHASQIAEDSILYVCTGCWAKLRIIHEVRGDLLVSALVPLTEQEEAELPLLTLQRFAAEEERLRSAQDRLIFTMFPTLHPMADKRKGRR